MSVDTIITKSLLLVLLLLFRMRATTLNAASTRSHVLCTIRVTLLYYNITQHKHHITYHSIARRTQHSMASSDRDTPTPLHLRLLSRPLLDRPIIRTPPPSKAVRRELISWMLFALSATCTDMLCVFSVKT